jgi:hypothetical protein
MNLLNLISLLFDNKRDGFLSLISPLFDNKVLQYTHTLMMD